jgi:SAM-dependent methyltransferase
MRADPLPPTHLPGAFYDTPRGAVASRLLRERLGALWPDVAGASVLGLGFACPYLRLWRGQARRCVALIPPALGRARWPAEEPGLSCAAEDDALPFPDLSFDRVLLVHGLEAAGDARRLLREVWRVLRDDGRVLIVAPNRRGMWAHSDSTPFGQGQPYSVGQVGRLLAACLFRVERRDAALWVPPSSAGLVLRAAPLIDRAGRRALPGFSGVTVTEAVKDVYAALPVTAPRRRVLVTETA